MNNINKTTNRKFISRNGMISSTIPFVVMAMAVQLYAQTAENTATISAPVGTIETDPSNNSATDSDIIFAALIADVDAPPTVDGTPGGDEIINVFTNDTLNGAPIVLAEIVASVTTPATPASVGAPVPILDPSTGLVDVPAGTPAGTYTIAYEICEAANPTNCASSSVTVEVEILNTELQTIKSRVSANASPVEGETVTYSILVSNSGPGAATNVTVTDLLPSGLTATTNNGNVTAGTYDAGTGVWTIPSLANGASATLTIEGTVDLGEGGNTIVNTIASPAIGDQPDPTTTGDDLTESVTIKGGTTGSGTINYATSGNGVNKGSVALLDWGGSSLDDGIQNGDVVNFTLPGCRTGTLTATFSNVTGANEYRPVDMSQVGTAATQFAYNGPGTGEQIYTQLGGSREGAFTVNWNYVENGVTKAPNIFFMDAEVTSNGETITATTNGGAWDLAENLVGSGYTATGIGSSTVSITQTSGPNHAPLLLSIGATQTQVSLVYPLVGQREGVAFGLLLPCDYSDGPATAGVPVHAFEQVGAASGLGLEPRSDQLLIGSAIDAEIASQPGATATGDDALGPNADDEDGVTLSGLKTTENDIIEVSVTEPSAGAGLLQAWIDWNGDGVFAAGEQIATDLSDGGAQDASATTGVIGVSVAVPADALVGNRIVRLRFSDQAGLDATSAATNGEVEDHIVIITQPQVNLVLTKTNTPGVNGDVDQTDDVVITGSTVTYVISVTNNGPDAVTGAIVTDVINSGLTCPATNAVTLAGNGVPAGSFTVADLTGAGITLATLGNGETVSLSYSCEVN